MWHDVLETANFLAFAPDGLTSVGGYPGDEQKGAELFGKVDENKMFEDFVASAAWLKSRPECTRKIGVVGFCFGGAVANKLAVRLPDLAAAVPFYCRQPSAADAAKIKAPLLLHYASLDARITEGWPGYEEALKANHVTYAAYIYEGANHGFHNDTTPRYDEPAAKLAWERTQAFMRSSQRSLKEVGHQEGIDFLVMEYLDRRGDPCRKTPGANGPRTLNARVTDSSNNIAVFVNVSLTVSNWAGKRRPDQGTLSPHLKLGCFSLAGIVGYAPSFNVTDNRITGG
jgi:dienelactone hydrolase